VSKIIKKVPFEIQVEEYELAEWFLERIPSNYWQLFGSVPTATDNEDMRNPSLLLRVTLDATPRIRLMDATMTELEASPIETTHGLRNTLLSELKEREKLKHNFEHAHKTEKGCWPCVEQSKGKKA
jgi:hypothetical protein